MQMKSMMAVAAAFAASVALADKVTFKSGATLTGTAGKLADGKLVFTSDDVGEVKIDIAKIATLDSAGVHIVQGKDGVLTTKAVTVVDGAYAVREGATVKPLAMENVKAIDPDVQAWHGSINASASATRGNTVAEKAAVFAETSRRWESDRVTASAGYYFDQSGSSKSNKQKNTSRFEIQAQEDHFWMPDVYSFVSGKYEVDRVLHLDHRLRIGAGFGYQWFENTDYGFGKMSFNQELGLSYVTEKYDGRGANEYTAFRYAHHFAWEVAKVDGLSFTHNLEYMPDMGNWSSNYLLDTDVGLAYAFRANWQLIARVEWDYKKKVSRPAKHSDLRYLLGIGYKW